VDALTNAAGSAGGLFSITADGTVTFNPNGAFEDLAGGQTRTTSIVYTLRDAGGETDTAAASVTVTGANDAPVATANTAATGENGFVSGNLLTDGTPDSDVDNAADTLTVWDVNGLTSAVGQQLTLPSGALLTVNANGSYSYNPNDAFEQVNFGGTATDSFQYTLRDPGGLLSTATVTITIHGADDGFVYFGDTVRVHGTSGADVLAIVLANRSIHVNGVEHLLPNAITKFEVLGLDGADQLTLYGTAGAETVRLQPQFLFLDSSTAGLTGWAAVETITYGGGGGADVATLSDSAGIDTFSGRVNESRMFGDGYFNAAVGVQTVFAYANSIGRDQANLFGTAGNDQYVGGGTGAGFAGTGITAYHFERVFGYGEGGDDRVVFNGTHRDERLAAGPGAAKFSSSEHEHHAIGFNRLTAAAGTGIDTADLSGSSGSDTLIAHTSSARLSSANYDLQVIGFDRVEADVQIADQAGARDTATFYDSPGNDSFLGDHEIAQLRGDDFLNRGLWFDAVTIVGTAGGTNRLRVHPPLFYTLSQSGTWV
jgi:VCBS repeat-containing protein